MFPERKETRGHNRGFEEGGEDGRKDPRDNPDEDVIHSPPHCRVVRVARREFFSLTTERFRVENLAALELAARTFAATLRAGDVIALAGDLGAGKTAFIAATVRALHGPAAEVTSPTFTFWHHYGGTPPVEHLDLYRIDDPEEAGELGLHEAFGPASITFVEWPERLPALLPANSVRISIAGAGDRPRELTIARPA